jgi:5-amino-6-(5-phosphoribosylamino)uracil reductase
LPFPRVILKSAMSIDGYIDDCSSERLLLSNEADFDRVDQVRSQCDAILVGAGTIRTDNPSLLVKSQGRQQERIERGLPAQPTKVTITSTGLIPKNSKFFTSGEGRKVIFCPESAARKLADELGTVATIEILICADLSPHNVLNELAEKGIKTLLIEGGTRIATSFLAANAVDEFQVSIAPFFVGEEGAPRLSHSHLFPHNKKNPMHLHNVERLGNVVLLTYLRSDNMIPK